MKERNPILVLVFGLITLGIYSWYWAVKTKGEMNKLGEKIPTAWIWLIPIVGSIWWYWKYSEGVEHVSNGKTNAILAFILLWILGFIGQAILQDSFNNLAVAEPVPANNGQAPAETPAPAGPQPVDQATVAPATPVADQPVQAPEQPTQAVTPEQSPQIATPQQAPTEPISSPTDNTQPPVNPPTENV